MKGGFGKPAVRVRTERMRQDSCTEPRKTVDVQSNHTPEAKEVSSEVLNNKWRTRGLILSAIGLGALFLPFVEASIIGAELGFASMLEVEEMTIPAMILCGIFLNLFSFWKVTPMGGYGGGALLLGAAYMINQEVAGSSLGNNIVGLLLVSKGSGFYCLLLSGIGSILCAHKLGKVMEKNTQ